MFPFADAAHDAIARNRHANLFSSTGEDHREKESEELFVSGQGGWNAARTYSHPDEAKCDQHMETFIKCIKASGEAEAESLKHLQSVFLFLTSHGGPQLYLSTHFPACSNVTKQYFLRLF